MIVRISPDTNTVNVRGNEFVVQFDEVVSEHPAGASTLADLVLISPRNNGAPVVDWHRDAIAIHPEKGWKANTPYTVTLLPGISDLRGNVRATTTQVTFSTGPVLPHTVLTGTLFDWTSGAPIATGLVEARAVTDTNTVYIGATDSIGHYRLRSLPPAQYAIRGYADPNRNRGLDPGEVFDSTRVNLADSLSLELLAFAHDSSGPRLGTVAAEDTARIRATFDTPLDPRAPLDAAHVVLTGPDGARIAITSATAARTEATTSTPVFPPVSQSAVPVPQPTAAQIAILPKPSRPLLYRDVTVIVATRLRSGATYKLQAVDATGPTGRKQTSDKTFTVPNFARSADTTTTRPRPIAPPRPAVTPRPTRNR